MANIVALIRPQIAFDPETITVLSAALEEAWRRLLQSGGECARPAYDRALREVVARRIIDMAQRGTKDKKELMEDAVRFLAANYRLEKKDRQTSSKTAVAPAEIPKISPGSGQNPPPP
jgi:plasmid stabilization system protein ParE